MSTLRTSPLVTASRNSVYVNFVAVDVGRSCGPMISAAATAMSAQTAQRGIDERAPGCGAEFLLFLPVRPETPRRGGCFPDGGGGGGSLLTDLMLRPEVARFPSCSAASVTAVNPPTARLKWLAFGRGKNLFQDSVQARVESDPDVSVQPRIGVD